MAVDEYYGGNIPLIKTNNLHENTISTIFFDYLTPKGNALISRTELAKDDIITTSVVSETRYFHTRKSNRPPL